MAAAFGPLLPTPMLSPLLLHELAASTGTKLDHPLVSRMSACNALFLMLSTDSCCIFLSVGGALAQLPFMESVVCMSLAATTSSAVFALVMFCYPVAALRCGVSFVFELLNNVSTVVHIHALLFNTRCNPIPF